MKNVDFEVGFTDKGAKAGFDGIDVSAKELQTRIAQLDAVMDKLNKEFGKNAYTMKAGVIAQRERGVALNQLIALEEKQNVVLGHSRVALGHSRRDLGHLASAAISASASIDGLGTGVSVLSNALMSGIGLTGALAAAVIAFSLFMEILRSSKESTKKAKEEIDNLTKSVENYSKVTAISIAGQLQSEIFKREAEHRKQIAGLEGVRPEEKEAIFQRRIWTGDVELASLKTKLSIYEKYIDRIGWERNLTNEIVELEKLRFEASKEMAANLTKIIASKQKELDLATKIEKKDKEKFIDKETVTYLTNLNDAYKDYLDILTEADKRTEHIAKTLNTMGTKKGMAFGAGGQFSALLGRGINTNELKAELTEMQKIYTEGITATLGILRSEFNQAWEDIFGEANSMFEKMITSWAETFFSAFSKTAFGFLLNLIPGGSAISSFLGLSKASSPALGKASSPGNSNQYNEGTVVKLYVDGKEFAQATVNANYKAQKLRLSAQ